MLVKKFYKEMLVEFVGTEECITFEVMLTQDINHFEIEVFESEKKTLNIRTFILNDRFNDFTILKNSTKYLFFILYYLTSSQKIVSEFPLIKEIEKRIKARLGYD